MNRPKHGWDNPSDDGASTDVPSARRHPWDDVDGWDDKEDPFDDEGYDSDVDLDDALTKPAAATQAFFDIWIDLYMTSTISAMTFCVGCFYLSIAGLGLFKTSWEASRTAARQLPAILGRGILVSKKQDTEKIYIVESQDMRSMGSLVAASTCRSDAHTRYSRRKPRMIRPCAFACARWWKPASSQSVTTTIQSCKKQVVMMM
jgi:hypothetical protein